MVYNLGNILRDLGNFQDAFDSYLKSIEESYFDYLKKQEITSVLLIDVTNVDFVKNENNYRKICKLISENYTKGETKNIIL